MLNGGFTVLSSSIMALSPVILSSCTRTLPAGVSVLSAVAGGAASSVLPNGNVFTMRTGRHSPFASRCTSDTTSRHSSTPIAIWLPPVTAILSAEITPADSTEPDLFLSLSDSLASFANTAPLMVRPATLISPFSSSCSFSTTRSSMLARLIFLSATSAPSFPSCNFPVALTAVCSPAATVTSPSHMNFPW